MYLAGPRLCSIGRLLILPFPARARPSPSSARTRRVEKLAPSCNPVPRVARAGRPALVCASRAYHLLIQMLHEAGVSLGAAGRGRAASMKVQTHTQRRERAADVDCAQVKHKILWVSKSSAYLAATLRCRQRSCSAAGLRVGLRLPRPAHRARRARRPRGARCIMPQSTE